MWNTGHVRLDIPLCYVPLREDKSVSMEVIFDIHNIQGLIVRVLVGVVVGVGVVVEGSGGCGGGVVVVGGVMVSFHSLVME